MYESMTTSQSYYNDLTKLQATPLKFRRRNLSLPSFVERRLNFETKNGNGANIKGETEAAKTSEGDSECRLQLASLIALFFVIVCMEEYRCQACRCFRSVMIMFSIY